MPEHIALLASEFANKDADYIAGVLEKVAFEGGYEAMKAIELVAVFSQA